MKYLTESEKYILENPVVVEGQVLLDYWHVHALVILEFKNKVVELCNQLSMEIPDMPDYNINMNAQQINEATEQLLQLISDLRGMLLSKNLNPGIC